MAPDRSNEPDETPEEFLPTRRSLISRLRNWDDKESWREFFDTYWRLIFSVCTKAGLKKSDAEDVVQETILSVAKKMPGFVYDAAQGSFKAWLMQITRRRIIDHFRKYSRGSEVQHVGIDTGIAQELSDPAAMPVNSIWEEEWRRNLMDVALRRVKAKIQSRHYQIFDLSVIKEWPIKDIVQTLKLNRAQVYLIKHRVSNLIKQEARRLEKTMNETGRSK